jgi:hypothetical protein
MDRKRRYTLSEKEKCEVVALSELNYPNTRIAKIIDCDEKTIRNVKKEYELLKEDRVENCEVLESKKRDISMIKDKFSSKCEFVLDNLFQGITKTKIDKAGLKDTAISIGIISEKLALFSSMSTQNIDVRHNLVNKIRTTQQAE